MGRAMSNLLRTTAAAALVVVLAAGCTDEPIAEPTPTPTPSPTPVQLEQPEPFEVELVDVDGENTDNARIFGRSPAPDDDNAVQTAATRAVEALNTYLNEMFVEPERRFTARPVSDLLTARAFKALDAEEKTALAIGLEDFAGARTGTAEATAIVVHDAGDVASVTLAFAAALRIISADGEDEVLEQSGTLLFTSGRNGLRADSLDVELTLEPAP